VDARAPHGGGGRLPTAGYWLDACAVADASVM
jgi:hypothetical protein